MSKRFLYRDQDYLALGVDPPTHITHYGSDTVRPDNHHHNWVHKGGAFIHCEQGNHGIPFDHLTKILIGTSKEGAPVFRDLTLSTKIPKM
jgi:hypothetical protein